MRTRDTDGPIEDDSLDWQFETNGHGLDADWQQLMQILPAHWQTQAVQLGAVRRQLRSFTDVESVLRVLLIHLADGCSLRETAARARAGGLADVSDVALFKRLRSCGPWFQWMTQRLSAAMARPLGEQAQLAGRRVRLIDGSTVSEPGATGSTWRLHYALNLQTLSCDEVHVTDASEGESLMRYDIKPGDIVMADRGYAHRRGLLHVLQRQADVVVRTGVHQIELHDSQQRRLDLLTQLRTLSIGQAADWQAWLPAAKQEGASAQAVAVRVCAYKKTAAQTRAAVQAIEQEARKKKRKVRPETLEAAGYVIVLTTLVDPSASAVMELYRRRWQVELAFKRLKSLLQLGHLKKIDEQGARAWLQGKLLVACLIETLILTAERFSPWGYLQPQRAIPAQALTLA
jgi:hypothetical protein